MNTVQFAVPPLTPLVKKLLIALGVFFTVQSVLGFMDVPFAELLALQPSMLGLPTLWQVFTYVLVQADPQSTLFAFVFFWLLVSPFEAEHGRYRTWQLIAVATLAPAAAVLLVYVLGGGETALFGIGRIGSAALVAFCWRMRNTIIRWFGILSLTGIQSIGVGVAIVVFIYLWTRSLGDMMASFAMMGGSVAFVEWMRKGPGMLGGLFSGSRKGKRGGFRVVQGGRDSDRPKWLN